MTENLSSMNIPKIKHKKSQINEDQDEMQPPSLTQRRNKHRLRSNSTTDATQAKKLKRRKNDKRASPVTIDLSDSATESQSPSHQSHMSHQNSFNRATSNNNITNNNDNNVNSNTNAPRRSAIPVTIGTTSPRRIIQEEEPVKLPLSFKSRSGYVYDAFMVAHSPLIPENFHPEIPDRITSIFSTLARANCIKRMKAVKSRRAIKDELMLIHSQRYINEVNSLELIPAATLQGLEDLYERTNSVYVNSFTSDCASIAVGSVIELTKAVIEDRIQNGFAIVRPPGHHAEPEQMMGFSFFNNAAVAARWAITTYPKKVRRVLILDWDVHHGNGTQKAFWDDPNVLYISIHRHENGSFYPLGQYGDYKNVGGPNARGYTVNVSWTYKGMGDAEYLDAFQRVIMPIAQEFNPDIVIVSAGYDSAVNDPLGENLVTPCGYAQMTKMLQTLANGRVIVSLEGGYDLDAIAVSALATVKTLLGHPPNLHIEPQIPTQTAIYKVSQVKALHSHFWNTLRPSNEPQNKPLLNSTMEPLEKKGMVTSRWYSLGQLLKDRYVSRVLKEFGDMRVLSLPEHVSGPPFDSQNLGSTNISKSEVIFAFVHDIGNLYIESTFPRAFNIKQLEDNYVYNSRHIHQWAIRSGFGRMEINVHMDFSKRSTIGETSKFGEVPKKMDDLMDEIWMKYISKNSRAKVFFIAYNGGCKAIERLAVRHRNFKDKFIGSAQIINNLYIPEPTANIQRWYTNRSLVLIPQYHQHLDLEFEKKSPNYKVSDGRLPAMILTKEMTTIQNFFYRRHSAMKESM